MKGSMRKLAFVVAALMISAVAITATATAGNAPSQDMLKFFNGGAGSISWTSTGGTSTAGDNQALKLTGTTQGADWSGAYAINATSPGALLSTLNASFDVKGYQGAGSPRISLPVDTNNDGTTDMWAYLSASYCTGNARSAVGTTGFDHIDFQKSGCTIYTSSGAVLNGLSDPINATGSITYPYGVIAFNVNDTGARVATDNQPFLVLDEAPAVSYVDNLTIGNYNWQRPGKPGFVKSLTPDTNATTDSGTMHWTSADTTSSFDILAVSDVTISNGIVAFSGVMTGGPWNGQVIQEYVDTNTNSLYGHIGGANVAPTLPLTGFDGPFAFTGPVTVS
jgi:hypothetical protein